MASYNRQNMLVPIISFERSRGGSLVVYTYRHEIEWIMEKVNRNK
jgi:hypothetical protein